jgi:FAD:protein FMN transferase
VSLLAALLFLAGPAVVTESRPAMGTLCTVTLAGVAPGEAAAGIEAAFAIFGRVDRVMNEWRPESPLSALNARAGHGWVDLPGDLCDVLSMAKKGAERTGGRFDPTWAALSDLWRFDGTQAAAPPEAVLDARCRLVGHRGLELAPGAGGGCRARLLLPGMRVGLGGIAKGWAVDRAVRALRALGFRDFLVQAGGDLYVSGRRGEAPWSVSVRDPHGGVLDAVTNMDVEDRAFSTSADSERFFEERGRRYHHVIDPRTCRPASGARSVSILAATAVEAEVLSKAVMVEGGPDGLRLASDAGAEAVLIDAEGVLQATPGLLARLRPAPPRP